MATAFSKSSIGPGTRHILASQGPSPYPLHFYSTTYSTQHGRTGPPLAKDWRHKGTGYSANFRPAVYYNKETDLRENPSVANILHTVYDTSMSIDFKRPATLHGYESLPNALQLGPSGYTHNTPVTRALYSHKASSNTKYRVEYPRKGFRGSEQGAASTHSRQEKSGYVHSFNVEPLTYRPTECHNGEIPGTYTWRPTGSSIMKKDYNGWSPMTGNESIPGTSRRANESNGYVKGNHYPVKAEPQDFKDPAVHEVPERLAHAKHKLDPARFSLITHPKQYTAYSKIIHTPQNIHPYANKWSNEVGKKEISGYTDNTLPHQAPPDQIHYNTSSGDHFSEPALPIVPVLDTVRYCTRSDGYTKSTRVHSHGIQYEPLKTIREQKPYVVKSILATDPCFIDTRYISKKRQ